MSSKPFHSVLVTFPDSSHYVGSYRRKIDAEAARRRYIAFAAGNAVILGIETPTYTSVDIVPTREDRGPFAV